MLRKLKPEEILRFAGRAGVRCMAVENFLMTMGTDSCQAFANLAQDKRLYRWQSKTANAIMDGIILASKPEVR